MNDTNDDLERARRFMWAMDERSAERTVDLSWGTTFFHDSLPVIWDLNFVGVAGPTVDAPPDLFAEAEQIQRDAGLKHRKLVVQDEESGKRLADAIAEGWAATPLVIMAARRPADRTVDTSLVKERNWSEMRPLIENVIREGDDGDPASMDQLVGQYVVTQGSTSVRYYAAEVDGELVAFCELYSDGSVAQVESVSTLEAFRKRGLGRAVVQLATEVARKEGHELVFLVADGNDWPRELYGKLGYDLIGSDYEFLKKPS